jgi:hypothetical protein
MKNMKSLTWIILMVLATVSVTSCKKDSNNVALGSNLVSRIESMPSLETQRIAYGTLSSSDKLILWQSHFNWAKANLSLNPQQVVKVDEIIGMLSVDFFEQNTNSDSFAIWGATITNNFNPKQLYLLFINPFEFDVEDFYGTGKLNGTVDGGGSGAVCHCSRGSNFCNILLSEPSNGMFECQNKCQKSGKQGGCGWLWKWDCDGVCNYVFYPGVGPNN